MNIFAKYIGFLLIAIALGCSTDYGIYDPKWNYEHQTDYSSLKTYDWLAPKIGPGISMAVVDVIKTATDSRLAEKGYKLKTGSPDFSVALYLDVSTEIDYKGYSVKFKDDAGEFSPIHYEGGRLLLDILDNNSMQHIWRGSVKVEIFADPSAAELKKRADAAVKEILSKFPPG